MFDIFGYSAERRRERALIGEYLSVLDELIVGLTPQSHALAIEIAVLPDRIRGFGHVKERSLEAVKREEAALLEKYRNGNPQIGIAAE